MPIAPTNNDYLLGIDKQTAEGTVVNVADYSLPVYASPLEPKYAERRIAVTDASAIQGDISKGLSWWESGDIEFPLYGDSAGRFLQTLWPTDTTTGAGPYTHTYSGLGGVQPWVTLYDLRTSAGTFYQRFSKGQATKWGITASDDETPARITFAAMGQEVLAGTAWTVTLADDLSDGYFTLQTATSTVEADFDTPNVNPTSAITNVTDVSIMVERGATPVQTVDGVTIRYIGAGIVAPTGTATLVWADWDAYRATFFGAVAGTALSSTMVTGALDLNFKHTTQPTWNFEMYIPNVQFRASAPAPSPDGGVLTLPVVLNVQKPTTGSHIQPILINSTSAAY